jgi:ABC-type dipeptide/oligopeptide/nickel transport system ATPase component
MSTNGKRDGIHVVGLDVETLHRIRLARVKLKPGGGLVKLTGRNGSGKTSLLRTVKEAFGGAAEVSEVPLHGDAETGLVRIRLSNDFTVTRRITAENPKGYLTVIAPDGGKHGQAKLNEWLGSMSFDPLAFFTLKPERQAEILFSIGKDPELKAKLADVRARHAKLYAERTPHISDQQRCRRVKRPEGDRPAPVDVSAGIAELQRLQVAQRERGDVERVARSLVDSMRINEEHQQDASNEISRLMQELEEAKANLEALKGARANLEQAHADQVRQLGQMPIVDAEIAAVQERLEQADAVNASLEPWKEFERAQEDLKKATVLADALTDELGQLKSAELRLIAAAGIPVPGLTFEPETCAPMLNGFPLELASGGERIRLAVAVAIAVDPELRICLVDEANDLDLEALEELDRLAQSHDFQVFACRIGIESPGEILLEDGVASNREEPAAV